MLAHRADATWPLLFKLRAKLAAVNALRFARAPGCLSRTAIAVFRTSNRGEKIAGFAGILSKTTPNSGPRQPQIAAAFAIPRLAKAPSRQFGPNRPQRRYWSHVACGGRVWAAIGDPGRKFLGGCNDQAIGGAES